MCSPLSYCPLCENTAAELERATGTAEPNGQAMAMSTTTIIIALIAFIAARVGLKPLAGFAIIVAPIFGSLFAF
jgi:hypothetical protein